jgi:hypothetical protein
LISTLISNNEESFYQLTDPFFSQAPRLTVRGFDDSLSTELSYKVFRGITKLDRAIKMGAYMGGSKKTDYLWTDLVYIFCISERIVRCFIENKITGWQTYPVEVFGKQKEKIKGYYGFSIIGGECQRDRSPSKIVTRQAVSKGKPFDVYHGLFFRKEDWDGSDIFIIRDYGGIVVTEKVYKLLKKEKVTNIKLIPLPEVEIDVLLDKYKH